MNRRAWRDVSFASFEVPAGLTINLGILLLQSLLVSRCVPNVLNLLFDVHLLPHRQYLCLLRGTRLHVLRHSQA